jgi:type IV secretory pathway TrbD component
MEPVRGAVSRPLPLLGAPRTVVILLWMFVLICLQVVSWKVGLAVLGFGLGSHLGLIWLQQKHPFAGEVFARIARGGNKPLAP